MLSYCSLHVSREPFRDLEMSCFASNSLMTAMVFLVWFKVASTSISRALNGSRLLWRKWGWMVLAQRVGLVVFWQNAERSDRRSWRLCWTLWMLLRVEGTASAREMRDMMSRQVFVA